MNTQLPVIQDRCRPFSCGTQRLDWEASNCDRCVKNTPPERGMPDCDIQRAICEASWGDGSITADVSRRMGYSENPLAFVWQCSEVVWTEEWKAEWRRRRTWRYRFAKARWRVRVGVRRWLRDTRQKWVQRWRMPIAERQLEEGTTGCWADWCSWAMDLSERPDEDSPATGCRADAERDGSCWCGKFKAKA